MVPAEGPSHRLPGWLGVASQQTLCEPVRPVASSRIGCRDGSVVASLRTRNGMVTFSHRLPGWIGVASQLRGQGLACPRALGLASVGSLKNAVDRVSQQPCQV
jgi:hypothetical protein